MPEFSQERDTSSSGASSSHLLFPSSSSSSSSTSSMPSRFSDHDSSKEGNEFAGSPDFT